MCISIGDKINTNFGELTVTEVSTEYDNNGEAYLTGYATDEDGEFCWTRREDLTLASPL